MLGRFLEDAGVGLAHCRLELRENFLRFGSIRVEEPLEGVECFRSPGRAGRSRMIRRGDHHMHRRHQMRSMTGWVAAVFFSVAGLASTLAQTPQPPPAGGQGRGAGGRGGPATPPLIMTTTAW